MKLHTLTISGPDDATPPHELLELSDQFPFVEWGILLSHKAEPRPRYPSSRWIESIAPFARQGVRFAGHICGAWAQEICKSTFPESADRPAFRRMQLNLAQFIRNGPKDAAAIAACLPANREYIVQIGADAEPGLAVADALRKHGHRTSVLFDRSGGRGISSDTWPPPVPGLRCGFAGGLGPENIADALAALEPHVGEAAIWLDMESNVRTADGAMLDLDKVLACLRIARPFTR